MTKVIKGEFENIKNVKVSRLCGMDNDLFTYEVEIGNIPCNSKVDDDSEDEVDDDMGYNPSDALQNKASMEGLISNDDNESCYEQRILWNVYTNFDDAYEIKHDKKELCEVHEPPICNIRKYMMIKYSFNNDDEYVAVEEDEYDDLTITRKRRPACKLTETFG
ncbi:hypothetical protein Tco_1336597 [Tanacetum coccineum]